MKKILLNELRNFSRGVITLLLVLFLLYVWRYFDTSIFLFLQIAFCSIAVLFFLYLLTLFKFRFFQQREMISVLIAFVFCSTLLLNIDRSRSVYILKWVEDYQSETFVSIEKIAEAKNFSNLEASALKQRVMEQKQTLMLTSRGSGLRLTGMGEIFIKTCRFFALIFNLRGFLGA